MKVSVILFEKMVKLGYEDGNEFPENPDYLSAMIWLSNNYGVFVSLEKDGCSYEWVSCHNGWYLPGNPYEILESNLNEAMDEILSDIEKGKQYFYSIKKWSHKSNSSELLYECTEPLVTHELACIDGQAEIDENYEGGYVDISS
jgi:hypothetical protein